MPKPIDPYQHDLQRERLFQALKRFLRANAMLVADARDSNYPWDLLTRLNNWETRDEILNTLRMKSK